MNDTPIHIPLGGQSQLEQTGGNALGRRALLDRYMFQLPLVIVLVAAIQILVIGILFPQNAHNFITTWTIAITQCANVAALLIFREIRRVPGTRKFSVILPSFLIAYAVPAMFVLVFRLPYSLVLTTVGFTGGILFVWIVHGTRRVVQRERLHIVPNEYTMLLLREVEGLNADVLDDIERLRELNDGAIIVDLRDEISPEWEREIARAVLRGIPVYHVKQIYESFTGRVRIDSLSENAFGALVPSKSYLLIKRGIDIILSALGLFLLAIPMVLVAILIKRDSPGPAIFRHTRMGYRGKPFKTLKFRTMQSASGNDTNLESQMTAKEDPRITKVGRFLRKVRLDEMPQLINVLRGEMSLIGPRPEALALSDWYQEHLDFYDYRHILRPGITGWAQVNQGHVVNLDDVMVKTQYDFYYIKNLSGWLDFLILLRTISVVLKRDGAH